MVKIHRKQVKSILTKSNLPNIDYVINPYTGCSFACAYCYASFMGRFVDEPLSNWGNYVYIKENAVELLDKKLSSMRLKDKSIMLATATDAWQYIEKTEQITMNILQTLLKYNYPGKITCLTKSNLIIRDLDLIKQFKNIEVGFTLTSAKNQISREFETAAPNVETRFEALKQFNQAGVKTYAFIAPVLPYFMDNKEDLEDLFIKIKEAGTTDIYIDMLNTKDYIANNLELKVHQQKPEVRYAYFAIKNNEKHAIEFKRYIMSLVKKYDFNLRNTKRGA